MKDARAEAQKEIEEYRKAKHDEFKRFENEVLSQPWIWPKTLLLGRRLLTLDACTDSIPAVTKRLRRMRKREPMSNLKRSWLC